MLHDVGESIIGDITPYENVTKAEKRALEEVRCMIMT
jgi:5'-deoxynucleotidase YfbR-like HD superfamily hydrolase